MRLSITKLFYFLAVVVMIGCSNDSEYSPLSEDEKLDKAIETVEVFMESVISQCDEIEDYESYLGTINNLEGIEKAWLEENGLCVKVENGGVLVWFFTPEEISIDESTINCFTDGIAKSRNTDSNIKICNNQKVCIINQFSEDPSRKAYIELYDNFRRVLINNYNFEDNDVEIVNADKLTLDFITNDLPQYGIVFFATHGGYINGKHWLLTGHSFRGEVDKNRWIGDYIRMFYLTFEDSKTGRKTMAQYVGFNENFLSENSTDYPDNSIMFCTACESFKGNNNLAKIFQSKNLGCFIGYDETNYQGKKLGLDFLDDLIVTNATVAEEYQRVKLRFDAAEISSTKSAGKNHNPAKLMCYPVECNLAIREDIGEIMECVQTKSPKCAEDSVFFSFKVTANYIDHDTNVKEWGITLYKGEEVNKLYPVSNVAEGKCIDMSFYLFKDQLNLDYNNYIATPKEQWSVGVYEVNDKGVTLYSRNKEKLELIYDQKPSIALFDLEVGEIVDIDAGVRNKERTYNYKIKATGILFMDEWYQYASGAWTKKGKWKIWPLYDANWWWSMEQSIRYNSSDRRSAYLHFEAVVNGEILKSTNYLLFSPDAGVMNISLVDGTVDSKSRSVDDAHDIYGLELGGLPIHFE